MPSVAIVEKYPSNYPFDSIFPFEFERFALVESKTAKVLKRDVTLDMDFIREAYDFVILVGKEPCKLIADIRSVSEFQGYLVEDKYLGMLNPIAVKLNPSQKSPFDKSISDIIQTISGEKIQQSNFDAVGIEDEAVAHKYLLNLLALATSREVTKVAMDTETSSFYPREGYVLGISLAYTETAGVYIASEAMSERNVELLQKIIDIVEIIFFNKKFDKKMLQYHFNFKFNKCHDAMLEHYVIDENDVHALKPLCIKYTDLGNYDKELDEYKTNYCKSHGVKVSEFSYDLFPFNIISGYAAYDAGGTLILHNKFNPIIMKNPKLKYVYENLLLNGSDFLLEIEENGIPINLETLEKERTIINEGLEELTAELYTYPEVKKVEEIKGALFNVNSTHHVGCLFFEVLKLPVLKLTSGGKPSADSEVLSELAKSSPVAETINNIKKLKKIKSTYLDKIAAGVDIDGRFRTSFNLHTTTSGRLSSSGKLNAQQLPRENKAPKNCMQAKEGRKIVSQDLKTAEMYVAAVLSGDKVLQEIFVKKQDYHGSMAIQKFNLPCQANEVAILYPNERQAAKTISFEILYKLNYREEALKTFKVLKKWLQAQEAYIKEKGFIYSFFGRKRRLADVFSPDRRAAQHFVRSGINFLVQSVSSDINLLAGIEMQDWIMENGYQDEMIIWGLVHDSILADVQDEFIDIYIKQLAIFTQKDRGLSIPGCPIGLDVEVGQSYGTVKPI